MNQQQAAALIMYLQRCRGIIPTTGAEWDVLSSLFPTIEAVANGRMQCVVAENSPPTLAKTAEENSNA